MTRSDVSCVRRLAVVTILVAMSATLAGAEDLKPEEIVSRHLSAIGPQESRAAIQSRVVQGKLKFHLLIGGGGEVTGTWGRVSEQRQSNFVMRFAAGGDWRGEQFIFDGSKVSFATATSSHTRSVLAQFVSSQDFIVREGLLGGEFSTGWALQHLDETHARLQALGRKKIDGRELIGIQYYSKASTDMQVKIYFEPDTYRHVLTEYVLEVEPNMSSDITNSVNQNTNRYAIQERFSEFQAVDGLTLPTHYDLQYTQEVQARGRSEDKLGTTRVYDWEMNVEQIRHNLTLDAGNFRAK